MMKRKVNFNLEANFQTQLDNYPELEKEDILLQINRLGYTLISEIVEGKRYKEDYAKVFGYEEHKNLTSEEIDKLSENSYDPYSLLEKSREIEEIEYKKMNLFSHFEKYNNFLKAFEIEQKELDKTFIEESENTNKINLSVKDEAIFSLNKEMEKEKIETFIKCLCKIYIGHSIHQRINNEISKKTNLFILKGDYFISLGYSTVTTLGNPLVIRFYSKIAENFAKSMFYIRNLQLGRIEYQSYINHLVKKYVGFIYYGCCGINELRQNLIKNFDTDLMKEFSFKFGLLLYLKEELSFIKNKSNEYYSKVDDLVNAFLFFAEPFKSEFSKSVLYNYIEDKTYLYKYKYFAVNLCADLLDIIDRLTKHFGNDEVLRLKNIDEMRNYLKEICINVESLTMI